MDAYGLGLLTVPPCMSTPIRPWGPAEWGSYNFMHSRGEVRSFCNLRPLAGWRNTTWTACGRAISRLLYWQGEEARGVNGNGAAFLREMNRGLKEHCPGCMLIAEDSTSYPDVTKPVEEGGLASTTNGPGWMHDTWNTSDWTGVSEPGLSQAHFLHDVFLQRAVSSAPLP